MYDSRFARHGLARATALGLTAIVCAAFTSAPSHVVAQSANLPNLPSVIRKISESSEQLELTTNSSRILTLEKRIPRVQVNNPDMLAVTPLSADQVQVSAKKTGVTQVNLWDEDGNIHTIDVIVYGDARELEHALKTQFPHSSIRVYRYSNSLVLKGFVDRPDYVSQMIRIAEDYAPKVVNNIMVGGVQQILLRVRVFEVSRTKLRRLGVDWAHVSSAGAFVANGVSGLIANVTSTNGITTVTDTGGANFQFGIVDGGDTFFGLLDALQQHNVAKILAEPNIVAVSGRPAQFNVGGEIPILVPQSLGTASIEFKKFGTQVDFLPVVLGNGNIRLEVRPRVSEIDDSRSVNIQNFVIPALTVREVDTGVEMKAGQTLALAGLVQTRVEAINKSLPIVGDIPYIGMAFRSIEEDVNEVELLILVTPEFADAMDPHEVPPCAPGLETISPSCYDFYLKGHLEVPRDCNNHRKLGCNYAGCNDCVQVGAVGSAGNVCVDCADGVDVNSESAVASDGGYLQDSVVPQTYDSNPEQPLPPPDPNWNGGESTLPPPVESPLPPDYDTSTHYNPYLRSPSGAAAGNTGGYFSAFGGQAPPAVRQASRPDPRFATSATRSTQPRQFSPNRAPQYMRNYPNPHDRGAQSRPAASPRGGASLIGPIGYDVQK